MSRNYYVKLDVARFLLEVFEITATERGDWVTNFAKDLARSDADNCATPFARDLITEADMFRAERSASGRKGGLSSSSAQAQLDQGSGSGQAKKVSRYSRHSTCKDGVSLPPLRGETEVAP
jgi:hypothetical protein